MSTEPGKAHSDSKFSAMLAMAIAIVILSVSLLGCAGSIDWRLDLLSHFRAQYLTVSLVGLLVGLAKGRLALNFMFASAAMINAALVAPLYIKLTSSPSSGKSEPISIRSYNTWSQNPDWRSIQTQVERATPDIVFLTESHPDVLAEASRLESDFKTFIVGANIVMVRRGTGWEAVSNESLEIENRGIVLSLSNGVGFHANLVALHAAAPIDQIHAQARDELFERISRWVTAQRSPSIVIGDFNATPWSHGFRILQQEKALVNSQSGYGLQTSWPSYPDSFFNWCLRIPIDHCLHSPEIDTVFRRVGKPQGSNHNPLLVFLSIPERPDSKR